ncbi:hypothetical protein PG1629B_1324 [Bifidobacterium pseudolongum subsp. pseudolongum]|nr:hypothetical protein CQR49_1353 [Bifidobacterium pseudolongum subsp. pseudolongum]RYQ47722.1 hypothetical protein PG1629B_1324 [Bifidobacterium pseudolongum subsp. pseudolongum]RYQ51205.1 hypothetical protein PG1612B_1365 [Bifidobacterium pseudolongum subsp. pseudolongum]RYQ51565.1 hypothetical protein PG1604B_1307 [Bifidobacterium pseudolongum subsp. pseudolongum]RYQ61463.1 hypothetical protein PG1513B_1325 [Bifidobacterium pseudolongum subsp. pseudolongum]
MFGPENVGQGAYIPVATASLIGQRCHNQPDTDGGVCL